MISFEIYNKIVLGLAGLMIVSIIVTAIYMEPHSGELTRMGGYLENEFGWNLPQERFLTPLFKQAASLDEYDQYYDVVVFGDSFSEDVARGWQNYLVAKTGWSVITFSMVRIALDELLETQTYRNSPPKLLIYQSVERYLIGRISQCSNDGNHSPQEVEIDMRSIRSIDARIVMDRRRQDRSIRHLLDASPVFNYWRKSFARKVFNADMTKVHKFRLNTPGLFSNDKDDHLLVFTGDLNLKGTTSNQIETTQCGLLELQNRIQGTGETAFLTLIFPDKTSVYSDYIDDEEYRGMSILSRIEETPGLNIAKLKAEFDKAIENGVIDLYLPNDTHCGFYGFKMSADAIFEFIAQKGWIAK